MNSIRFHEISQVPDNGERWEIMRSITVDLIRKLQLHDSKVLRVTDQTVILSGS